MALLCTHALVRARPDLAQRYDVSSRVLPRRLHDHETVSGSIYTRRIVREHEFSDPTPPRGLYLSCPALRSTTLRARGFILLTPYWPHRSSSAVHMSCSSMRQTGTAVKRRNQALSRRAQRPRSLLLHVRLVRAPEPAYPGLVCSMFRGTQW